MFIALIQVLTLLPVLIMVIKPLGEEGEVGEEDRVNIESKLKNA